MNTEDNRHIDELISNVLEDNVPADVDRRLRSQLEKLWRQLEESNNLPGVSLADVATAVLMQPWIHGTGTSPDGKTNEFWYSPVKDVSAWRENDWIEYREHRSHIYYAYDLHDKVLYRVPEAMRRGKEQFALMIASISVLVQIKQPVDNLLECLGFPEDYRSKIEILKQEVEEVNQDGRDWLDYRLTMTAHEPKATEAMPAQMLHRVDPQTKLVQLWRHEFQCEGRSMTMEAHFDYPEKGPADVYDLGVPKAAKLVDRVPSDELSRILETIRAGRDRMDDYCAIFVRGKGVTFSGSSPMIMYRKGNKFRTDGAALFGDLWKVQAPKADEDMGAWWKDRVTQMVFAPIYINHGPIEYRVKKTGVTDPDGSEHAEIAGVERREHNMPPGETYPAFWSWMPEFACRPSLGIPHETMEAVLDPNPKEGPAGTILLDVRNIGPELPPWRNGQGNLIHHTTQWRNWLDPTRDYAVVRHDMIATDESGKEEVHSTIIDEMAKSPQGTWYATRFRVSVPMPDGKTLEDTYCLYLDFNVDLPDSLFEPPAPGRIH